MSRATTNWFCIYSTVAGEFRALADLEARNIPAYLPLATKIRHIRGQRRERQTPLLPRYLFICLEDFNRLGEIRDLATVSEILPHDFEPQAISSTEIVKLQEREASGEFIFKPTATDRRRRHQILRSFKELAVAVDQGMIHAN